MLRMAAELVAAMEGTMGSNFDAEQTVVDFVRAMRLDSAFREQVEDAHRRAAAVAASKLPKGLLTPLQPTFDRLLGRCGKVLRDADD